jgi:hypothetical protein
MAVAVAGLGVLRFLRWRGYQQDFLMGAGRLAQT